MSRDYKNMGGKKDVKPGMGTTSFLAFLSGLSIGLLVAFIVYLYQVQLRGSATGTPAVAATAQKPGTAIQAESESKSAVPRPTFDFYKILPSREVNVSEWVAENPPPATATTAATPATATAGETGEIYILQVGSFKTAEAADQAKAKLALIGIGADVQRVVINGQDAVHRVRIGPYRSPEKFEEVRQRLISNGIDFIVVKLKIGELPTGEG